MVKVVVLRPGLINRGNFPELEGPHGSTLVCLCSGCMDCPYRMENFDEDYSFCGILLMDVFDEIHHDIHHRDCPLPDYEDIFENPPKEVLMAMAQEQINFWNYCNPPGTKVIMTDDFGHKHLTRTTSPAWRIGDIKLVAVETQSGGYLLERIRPAEVVYLANGMELIAFCVDCDKEMKLKMNADSGEIGYVCPKCGKIISKRGCNPGTNK